MYVVVVVVSAVIFIVCLIYFVSVLTWHDLMDETAPSLTFKSFRELYALNPQKWSFWSEYVTYSSQRIEFARYSDVIKYKIFSDKVERYKLELERIQNEKELLKQIQCDIDTYRRKNIEEMGKRLQK